jgi:CHAT domain-containing protein
MEACYLAHNSELAFFFMEKSRAVMLNDKLNELGASAYLPESEKIKEQEYRRKLLTAQQEWASVPNTTANETQPLQLLQAKEDFERYIQSLEKKYPAYYQYKYAEDVPSLQALQQYLAVDNKSFVHYFLSDTIAYMLSITPIQATLQKVAAPVFNYDQITAFLNLCADKQMLNNNYSTFAALSNKLYTALFQPLPIPDGKVIICADNFLLPFEAFCKDTQGRQFLVKEYIFSYVYSARNLLKNIASFPAEGNFIGFAPVSFQPYLDVPDLKESAISLEETANHYSHTQLFTGTQATKENFIHHIAPYRVVNVFSHASADTTFSEPLLYMQDSVIKLSELQFTPEQATRLVILSACETNVGKHAGGEGIYSLARGFASAGIPAVAATLWKADEQAIYAISKKFNQYLSQGMPKDEALQQAKLDLLTNSSIEKSLPYFWASMIIIGNTEPIKFAESTNTWWWIGAGVIACVVISLFLLWRFRRHA